MRGRPPGCCRPVRQQHNSLEVRSMGTVKKRGPGPSSLLMTPDHAGNVVGVDPHKRTLSATVADARGGILASAPGVVDQPAPGDPDRPPAPGRRGRISALRAAARAARAVARHQGGPPPAGGARAPQPPAPLRPTDPPSVSAARRIPYANQGT